jgi:tetratricopeptide (TPR) repeat protein
MFCQRPRENLRNMSPITILAVLVAAGCTHRPHVKAPAPPANVETRLAAAEQLVRLGCFDCLTDALREYDGIRAMPNVKVDDTVAATIGSFRAMVLLDLRERELGMTDDGYFGRAQNLLAAGPPAAGAGGVNDDLARSFQALLDAVDTIPWRVARPRSGDADVAALRQATALRANLPRLTDERRAHADEDELSAYVWLAFSCTHGTGPSSTRNELESVLPRFHAAPIIAYRNATCRGANAGALADLLEREPRFAEVHYLLGMSAIGAREVEKAEALLMKAYEWRPRWPAVTLALANVFMTFEEFEPALEFYDGTLSLVPGYGEASIGRVRALSLLFRHADALTAIDAILNSPTGFAPGEAYYWRAWNDVAIEKIADGWSDIQQAERLWVNANVSKLAGVIAYRRRELGVARVKFEEARRLNPDDCETQYDLGNVLAEQSQWSATLDTFAVAATCLEGARETLRQDLSRIEASTMTSERKARQIANREEKMTAATRMLAQSWFNSAAACFNLSRKPEARQFAEKLLDDEQFGARARDLIARLEKD